jgi:hypothetical protein
MAGLRKITPKVRGSGATPFTEHAPPLALPPQTFSPAESHRKLTNRNVANPLRGPATVPRRCRNTRSTWRRQDQGRRMAPLRPHDAACRALPRSVRQRRWRSGEGQGYGEDLRDALSTKCAQVRTRGAPAPAPEGPPSPQEQVPGGVERWQTISSNIDASSWTASIWRSREAAKLALRLAHGLPLEFKRASCSIKVMTISYAHDLPKSRAGPSLVIVSLGRHRPRVLDRGEHAAILSV